jgi:hypothetical protein
MTTTYSTTIASAESTSYSPLEESGRLLLQACVTVYGIRFGPQALLEMHKQIEEGAIKIRQLGDEDNLEKLLEAQENLVRFVYEIVQFAKGKHLTSIDTIPAAVKLEFCPVYPFK